MKWIGVLGIVVCAGTFAFASEPVPRPAPEFTFTQPSGKQSLLSDYRGKVVLIQFLYTTCSHCAQTAATFSKLQADLGPRGLQVLGVAFNPEARKGPDSVGNFVNSNGVRFPVGISPFDTVLSYLHISSTERFMVPQVVVVDRKGVIRAQSEFSGTPQLQDEAYMRSFLDSLLKEPKPPAAHKP